MGGYCINEGLPQYVEIDRNTYNVSEIQNSTKRYFDVMIQLKLVKTEEKEKNTQKRIILESHMVQR